MDNLSPQEGSRRKRVRVARGYGGHKGGTAGRGMRGQKSRAGATVRPGFEGGQMPLYRRLPKLKGIAGGMGAGLPDFVVVNVGELNSFGEGEEVCIDVLKSTRRVNTSGRADSLPLKARAADNTPAVHETPLHPGNLPAPLQLMTHEVCTG